MSEDGSPKKGSPPPLADVKELEQWLSKLEIGGMYVDYDLLTLASPQVTIEEINKKLLSTTYYHNTAALYISFLTSTTVPGRPASW